MLLGNHATPALSSYIDLIFLGHYLPAITDTIVEATKAGKFKYLDLKGIILGNPWTSPVNIFVSLPDFAEANDLISKVSWGLRSTMRVWYLCRVLLC